MQGFPTLSIHYIVLVIPPRPIPFLSPFFSSFFLCSFIEVTFFLLISPLLSFLPLSPLTPLFSSQYIHLYKLLLSYTSPLLISSFIEPTFSSFKPYFFLLPNLPLFLSPLLPLLCLFIFFPWPLVPPTCIISVAFHLLSPTPFHLATPLSSPRLPIVPNFS